MDNSISSEEKLFALHMNDDLYELYKNKMKGKMKRGRLAAQKRLGLTCRGLYAIKEYYAPTCLVDKNQIKQDLQNGTFELSKYRGVGKDTQDEIFKFVGLEPPRMEPNFCCPNCKMAFRLYKCGKDFRISTK